jgi:hypothetical protein
MKSASPSPAAATTVVPPMRNAFRVGLAKQSWEDCQCRSEAKREMCEIGTVSVDTMDRSLQTVVTQKSQEQ